MQDLEIARGNILRPNGHGGFVIRQSDLSSWAWCPLRKFYEERARRDPDAPQPQILSATTYGSVVHYALQVMEKAIHEGREDALDLALKTFAYYWHPSHTEELDGVRRVNEWIARQSYDGLLARGKAVIKDWYELTTSDKDSTLLALEYQFAVPMEIDGRLHTLTGTIDRLEIGRYYRKPILRASDYKTGKQPYGLRWNQQGSAYSWATTLPSFWFGWPESGMGELPTFDRDDVERIENLFASWGFRLHEDSPGDAPLAARKFRWTNLQEIKFADGGWRTERDYARLKLAVDGYIRSCEAEAYAVNMSGDKCQWCSFQKTCGGVGLPGIDEGRP